MHQIEDWHGPSQLMALARSVAAPKVHVDEGHACIIPGTLSRRSKDCVYPSPSAHGNLDTEQEKDLVGIGSWAQPIARVAAESLKVRSRNVSAVAPRL